MIKKLKNIRFEWDEEDKELTIGDESFVDYVELNLQEAKSLSSFLEKCGIK